MYFNIRLPKILLAVATALLPVLLVSCDLREVFQGPANGDLRSIRASLRFDPQRGLSWSWVTTRTIPWIERVVFRFDQDVVEFSGFWREASFDYYSIPAGFSSNFQDRFLEMNKRYFDFNSNGTYEAESDPVIEWKSSEFLLEVKSPPPFGETSVLRPGIYTYNFPGELVRLKNSYTRYVVEVETVTGEDSQQLTKLLLVNGSILPQIALGRAGDLSIESRIDATNPNTQTASAVLRFFTSGGDPWPVQIGDQTAAEHTLNINAESSVSVTIRSDESPAAGWALATAAWPDEGWIVENTAGVDFNVTFTTYLNGVPDAEAGLAGASPGNARVFGSQTDLDQGLETGFALANPFEEQVSISVTFEEEGGQDPVSREVTLPPLGQTAVFFSTLFPDVLGPQAEGTIRFFSDHDFGVVQLRTKDSKQFSSLSGSMWR